MKSEIVTSSLDDGTQVFELRGAKIFKISDITEGVSQSNGMPWRIQYIHVALCPGNGTKAHCMRLQLADKAIKTISMRGLQEGDYINAKIEFHIFGQKYFNNGVRCFDIDRV